MKTRAVATQFNACARIAASPPMSASARRASAAPSGWSPWNTWTHGSSLRASARASAEDAPMAACSSTARACSVSPAAQW
jgi:hypothetical protein